MEQEIGAGNIWFGKLGNNAPRIKKFLTSAETRGLTPETIWYANNVGTNDEAKKNLIDIFGAKDVFDSPKPVSLIEQVVRLATKPGDIILDSFAGSGTTGHAVLQLNKQDGGNRRFILVEMDSNICRNVTAERLRRVCQGYERPDGIKVEGLGGGVRFCRLGTACFDEYGRINAEVTFSDLARHIFFTETGEPIPKQAKDSNPLIGIYKGTAVYLLYNGILKDKQPDGGNVLTQAALNILPKHDGPKVVYGTACRFSPVRLKRENIVFKQIPYEIRVR
jgi:site-specific DNA-methyltransferase (adenine-specific)/adenine-specific DNA-methyltransferase